MADYKTNLRKAIYTLYKTANDFRTAMTGGLWYVEAKPNNDFPYCTFSILSGKPMYYFSNSNPDEGEDILVQFSIFDKSASSANIELYSNYLKSLFDWCSLTITDYTLMEVRRTGEFPPFKKDDVWQATVTYRIKIDKT